MLTLIWGHTFLKSYKKSLKKYPDLRFDIEKALNILTVDPFDRRLSTHKLKGKLSGSWAWPATRRTSKAVNIKQTYELGKAIKTQGTLFPNYLSVAFQRVSHMC